jgi:hypothetical protein
MSEHDERADELEGEADKMEKESERVGGNIDDARDDWESKQADPSIPGAQGDPDEEEDEVTEREESDQLPEEGPGEQVPDDDGDSGARDDAQENPGVPEEDEQATGNPDAAGSSDPDESD